MLKTISKLHHLFDYQQAQIQTDLSLYRAFLEKINQIKFRNYTDQQLKQCGNELKRDVNIGNTPEDLLIRAYALTREVSRRVLRQYPYDIQILAGLAMQDGKIVEMMTGEGKTLAAVFPAYLNALTGKGVHILTFNDYLAERDASWMGPVFDFLGLSVGFIRSSMSVSERKSAYACDLTYTTAKEAGFDYLKSFLSYHPNEVSQRPFHFALIDEADSILIDEGRIPLVIAGKQNDYGYRLQDFVDIVRNLDQDTDYRLDDEHRNVYLTESGISRVEAEMGINNLYTGTNTGLLALINNALHAEVLLRRDVDYIVQDGRIALVDEFTGRVVENRRWPNGLHEALEAKEGLENQPGGRILGTITMQHFLKAYPKIAGMTGTAQIAADELKEFYNLDVAVIPPNCPCERIDEPDRVFITYEVKMNELVKEIGRVHDTGRPILIGSGSVQESEQLAERLGRAGIAAQLLNAKNDKAEADIIADAGLLGAVTISTNMAGRGTDIRLGGKDEHQRQQVVALGGLYVIGLQRFESLRVDLQLRGRAGRQGDPGSSRFFVSLEDELLVRFGITGQVMIKQDWGDEILNAPEATRQIAHIQRVIEAQNFEVRKNLWKYSWLVEEERQTLHRWRQDVLYDREIPAFFKTFLPERYELVRRAIRPELIREIEKTVFLYHIDRVWADFLEQVSIIREGIHLVQLSGRIPLVEFHRALRDIAGDLREQIQTGVIETLGKIDITPAGFDLKKEEFEQPSATWTYLINDTPFERNLRAALGHITRKFFVLNNG